MAKHILRYVGMMEETTGEPLAAELQEAVRELLPHLGRALPAAVARQCRLRWRAAAWGYALRALLGGRKAARRRSQARCCRLLAEHLIPRA